LPFELILSTPDGTHCIPLAAGTTASVGRGDENLIRLDHGSVSRVHARIHTHPGGVDIEDLGSANGTTIIPLIRASPSGGHEKPSPRSMLQLRAHERRSLAVGDVVRIGPALLSLQRIRSEAAVRASSAAESVVVLDSGLRKTYELAHQAAASDISILITGETGVGKEALARRVHELSRRKSAPFWLVDCAELSESLLNRVLFGQVQDSPMNAGRTKLGLFELTRGGTIFLDEVGQLPLVAQAKLQRVLEGGDLQRSSSSELLPVDVRFVSATNIDLMQAVRAGRFRSDLFYRLGGLVLNVPPLRKRSVELEPLARHFLRDFCARIGHFEPRLTSAALATLHSYDWPGNVRELKNVVERAALLADSGEILPSHVLVHAALPDQRNPAGEDVEAPTVRFSLPIAAPSALEVPTWNRDTAMPDADTPSAELDSSSEREERARYLDALKSCAGNQTRAAELLGVSRKILITRLNQWNVPRPKRRPRRSGRLRDQ
jgi:DNA-binding NtrC family response regulator